MRAADLGDSELSSLSPIADSDSLTSVVEGRLRRAILSGELEAGARLSVPELARRLGVSRSPVRDAIYALERSGLAELRPRLGAVVLRGGRADLGDLFELREALEGMAARLAAERMAPDDRRRLREVMAHHERAVHESDLQRHLELDAEFHRLVNESVGNARLSASLRDVHDQIMVVVRAAAAEPGGMGPGVLHDHNAIADAVCRSEPDEAEREARRHVRAVLRFVLDVGFAASEGATADQRG
ncbi:GntR family transcriptional regulator [Actinomadura rugatobispora]|uniref:GntR family transcriptional regulator n=1 Tax=Actinomadura rugatobispora TaxID=1994 RepID=A0ABW0ZZK9_9ACTN|nr:GntR family transcriptional regulator [Actinomadura rugatobispora]